MAITIQSETNKKLDQAELRRFAARAMKLIGMKGDVAILITNDRRMKELNRWYRHKNYATDVLSFPGTPTHGHAGDVAISAEIATKNAASLRHSLVVELKVLILHGLLHLSGYDHESDTGEMAGLEDHLRFRLKLPTALISRTLGHRNGKKAGTSRKPDRMVKARAAVSVPRSAVKKKQTSRGRSATRK
ncbi:MAG TPA: rRNA maturation RNase YbeY [Terriglobales bacterium]|nr:rRNA maturation RNase YbeY [Terriglobales bacterium]